MNKSNTAKNLLYIIIILLFTYLLFFINLGEKGLWSSQEARNAIAAKTMLNGSLEDWIVPEIEGQRSTQKPILYHWLVNISCIAGGEISPFFVRLPSVICGLLCALYLFYVGQRLFSSKTGFLASIILVTCIKFLHMSRTSRIDILLTVCLTICLCELLLFYLTDQKRHLYAGYLLSGLAFLSKGPIGIIFPAVIVMTFLICIKDTAGIKKFLRPEAIVILLFVLIPYMYLVLKVTHGSFFQDFIIKHNLERFLGANGTFGKRKPIWFYIPHFLTGTLPWSLFIPILILFIRAQFLPKPLGVSPPSNAPTNNKKIHWFLLLWISIIFIFFSLSSFKRSDYILPLFPAFALLLAHCLTDEMFITRKLNWIKGTLCAVSGVLVVYFPIMYLANYLELHSKICKTALFEKYFNQNDAIMIHSLFTYFEQHKLAIFMLILINLCLSLSLLLRKSTVNRILASYILCFSSFYFFYYLNVEETLDKYCNLQPFTERIMQIADPAEIVFFAGWNHSIAFYINPEIQSIGTNEELVEYARKNQLHYFITSPKSMNHLPGEIEENSIVLLHTDPHLRKKFVLAKYTPAK